MITKHEAKKLDVFIYLYSVVLAGLGYGPGQLAVS